MAKKIKDLKVETYTPANMPISLAKSIDAIYDGFGDGSQEYLGIRTGLKGLDEATLGISGLIVLSGKAGGGKTSLALQIAYGSCSTSDTPVIIYSLEMSKRQILARLLSQISGIEQKKIFRAGRQAGDFDYSLSKDDYKALETARQELKALGDKIYIITRVDNDITFDLVKEQIGIVKSLHKSDNVLVVIDHLQVFNVDREKNYYADQIGKETALINGFKDLQEKTNATILLISQENKSEYNKGKIVAVKGSVDIIYLADMVMQIVGDDKNDNEDIIEVFDIEQEVKLKINKNRYGETRAIKLIFEGKTCRFKETK